LSIGRYCRLIRFVGYSDPEQLPATKIFVGKPRKLNDLETLDVGGDRVFPHAEAENLLPRLQLVSEIRDIAQGLDPGAGYEAIVGNTQRRLESRRSRA
jgi:hypothetical protein